MVVVIIGLLTLIAIPAFSAIKAKSRAAAVANDFRVFSNALNEYNILEGDWPHPNGSAGAIPEGMEGFLSDAWTRKSPVGGNYFFEHPAGQDAQLVIRSSDINLHVIELVDEKLDDGNLSTGLMRGSDMAIILTLL